MTPATVRTPVLIVGGGPVGFALALDLAQRGTSSTLVERDAGTALHLLAKAGTLFERSMEYCRRLGIAEKVAAVGFPDDYPRDTVYCTALHGFPIGRDPLPSTAERPLHPETPELLRRCPQYVFDPLLADEVLERGLTDVRYDHRLSGLTEHDDGVTATLETGDGDELIVHADYLVGCDGAGSTVRRALGIPFDGQHLDYSVSLMIYCADFERYQPYGRCERWMFLAPDGTWGNITTVDGRGLYRFTIIGSPDRIAPDKLDVGALLRRAIGDDTIDIPWHVVNAVPWRRSQCAASVFHSKRVVLAGDAAHTTSPTGGHGLNTSLGDCSDLGWMLPALLQGWGGAGLLPAYTAERRPAAIRASSQSTRNYKVWVENEGREHILEDSDAGQRQRQALGARMRALLKQEWQSFGVTMGYSYSDSPIIISDGTPAPPDEPSTYVQTARPGHRAPHAWLAPGRSTIDLFGDGFVLLAFGPESSDLSTLTKAADNVGMPLKIHAIDDPQIVELYERRLVLVRPDGMVAWRGDQLPEDVDGLVDRVRGAGRQS